MNWEVGIKKVRIDREEEEEISGREISWLSLPQNYEIASQFYPYPYSRSMHDVPVCSIKIS